MELVDYGEVQRDRARPRRGRAGPRPRRWATSRSAGWRSCRGMTDTFDLITCLDVIEHTPDDRVTLDRAAARDAGPGGWLLVTVPAYQALWSRHDEANHHYRRYARAHAARRGAGGGLAACERMSSFNSLLLAPAAAVRLAQRRCGTHNGDYNDLDARPGVAQRRARASAGAGGELAGARAHAPGRAVAAGGAAEAAGRVAERRRLSARLRGDHQRLQQPRLHACRRSSAWSRWASRRRARRRSCSPRCWPARAS